MAHHLHRNTKNRKCRNSSFQWVYKPVNKSWVDYKLPINNIKVKHAIEISDNPTIPYADLFESIISVTDRLKHPVHNPLPARKIHNPTQAQPKIANLADSASKISVAKVPNRANPRTILRLILSFVRLDVQSQLLRFGY